ncbi:MAG TPA: hypothetical protein PK275_04790 [Chitinophagaceae bacterium]|jgi:hypothetical protein|nr:hypothetical protein [Chitinophagaceae bacterium]
MNKLFLLLFISCTLCACPFESNVPLESKPVEPVDSSLLGYWYGIVKDGSDFFGIEALDISKQSDSTYALIRYGKGIKDDFILPDTSYFSGYTSYLGNQRYMNVEGFILLVSPQGKKKTEVKKQIVYYLSAIDLKGDTLRVRTITEDFSKKKNFNNSDEFKELVEKLTEEGKNIYDEQYSLYYRKIPRPKKH